MPSPFPGMDPYLENPALWPNVHGRLIVAIADTLSPLLLPKYQPIVEESVYRLSGQTAVMVGVPDVAIQETVQKTNKDKSAEVALAVAEPIGSPVIVGLPMLETVRQRFIEIRNTSNQEVVTVIEVLSPANKRGEGRSRYQQKRSRLLESQANLVEIDLLHRGAAMPTIGERITSHYRVLVSPMQLRPQALLYPFNLPMPLPQVPIPLRAGDVEPVIDFQTLLNQIYERSGYAFSINYRQLPKPSWDANTLQWIRERVE
ncbi:MAG: DUF4058 family protein [Phormidesmis sp.]